MTAVELVTERPTAEDRDVEATVTDLRRPPRGRLRLSVQRVGLWSVARTTSVLATVVATGLVGGGIGAWWMLRQIGVADGLERSVASGLGMEDYALPTDTMLAIWAGLVAGLALLLVTLVTLLAAAFNHLSRGIDVDACAERLESRTT